MAQPAAEGTPVEGCSSALDALLSLARRMAGDRSGWTNPHLGAPFTARLIAGEDPLGDRYSAIVSAQQRRSIGAVLTPPHIVRAMVEWAQSEAKLSGLPRQIVDAGAGTGRFAMAAARIFPNASIIAIENDPNLLLLLRANLKEARLNERISVIAADFRSITLEPVRGPTLFLGNPPYVRHHQISADWKQWYVAACARHGVKASRLAGAHLHFFAKIAELGKIGDYGCLITSAEWLDVGYGAALRALLSNTLGGVAVHILEPTARAFPDTMTTAAVTGFRIGRRPPVLRLRSVASPGDLDRLAGGRGVDWSALRNTAKWSILVRSSPKPPPGMIELGELCRVHRGQVTGANRIWIAGGHSENLPASLLKPTITRAAELIAAEPALDAHDHLARVIDLPAQLDEVGADARSLIERFLAWAHSAGAAEGYIARHRSPWWAVRLAAPAPILCTYMARRNPAFVRNRAGAHILNIAHGIYPREALGDTELEALVEALRSAVSPAHGRRYAGGLLKFEPREIERIPIPPFAPVELAREVHGDRKSRRHAAALG